MCVCLCVCACASLNPAILGRCGWTVLSLPRCQTCCVTRQGVFSHTGTLEEAKTCSGLCLFLTQPSIVSCKDDIFSILSIGPVTKHAATSGMKAAAAFRCCAMTKTQLRPSAGRTSFPSTAYCVLFLGHTAAVFLQLAFGYSGLVRFHQVSEEEQDCSDALHK